jgi:hypothetical protein
MLLGACGGKKADLAPSYPEGPNAVTSLPCPADGDHLTISIVNKGKKSAKASTTVLEFDSQPAVRLPTRPLLPGQSTELSYRIPDRCFSPDCNFRIVADAKDEIKEKDETNNSQPVKCPPQKEP